jgi:hypothetical protein
MRRVQNQPPLDPHQRSVWCACPCSRVFRATCERKALVRPTTIPREPNRPVAIGYYQQTKRQHLTSPGRIWPIFSPTSRTIASEMSGGMPFAIGGRCALTGGTNAIEDRDIAGRRRPNSSVTSAGYFLRFLRFDKPAPPPEKPPS